MRKITNNATGKVNSVFMVDWITHLHYTRLPYNLQAKWFEWGTGWTTAFVFAFIVFPTHVLCPVDRCPLSHLCAIFQPSYIIHRGLYKDHPFLCNTNKPDCKISHITQALLLQVKGICYHLLIFMSFCVIRYFKECFNPISQENNYFIQSCYFVWIFMLWNMKTYDF